LADVALAKPFPASVTVQVVVPHFIVVAFTILRTEVPDDTVHPVTLTAAASAIEPDPFAVALLVNIQVA
jgi:hypothetical protein